jgi:S1-C subfamily serine protease
MNEPTDAGGRIWPFRIACAILVMLLPALLGLPRTVQAGPLEAVVGVRATIPANARTAQVLGMEREGSGMVIAEDGLVLTIGYLILEAETAEILLPGDREVPAEIVAYDYDTGFGLLRPLAGLDIEPVPLGSSSKLSEHSEVLVTSFGSLEPATAAYVVSRRDFAGYWEYLLPDAIFTAPPHQGYGGAGLLGPDGRLLGIGSLFVSDAAEGRHLPGNMFVPIDALRPILAELLERGRASKPARPWLGVYAEEVRGRVIVNRVASYGPAAAAGLEIDDIILAVKDAPVSSLADFYRKMWRLGDAGVEVPLTVLRGAGLTEISVTSGDRYDYLKLKSSH